MKMTVNVPDKPLRDAMRQTKAKTKREAIAKALEENEPPPQSGRIV